MMWSIFEKVPCTLEKYVYFASLGWKALYISVNSICSRVLLSDTISLLIFCLEDLSIFDSWVLNSPNIILVLSICFLKFSKIFLCIWVLLCWVHIYLQCLCLLGGFFLWVLWSDLWVSLYGPFFEIYFVWYKYCYPGIFSLSVCLENSFSALHFQSV